MEKYKFTKKVEEMIDPIDVGTIHFMQTYSKIIPKKSQIKLIRKGSTKNKYMGFVVEPYSLFICHEITDTEQAQSLLPDNFILTKTKIFEHDTPKFFAMFGAFNVHTSAFWGTRLEFYIIAENSETGLLSWVIIDYDTNTISFDERDGLTSGNSSKCIFTTDFSGNIIVDIVNKSSSRKLEASTNVNEGIRQDLDQRLWLEGNMSVAYGKNLNNNSNEAFSVIFNPGEVLSALEIQPNNLEYVANTWFPGLFSPKPSKIAVFPYAQHFLSDSPGHMSNVRTRKQLIEKVESFDIGNLGKYSSKGIRSAFLTGQVISSGLIILLIIIIFTLIAL